MNHKRPYKIYKSWCLRKLLELVDELDGDDRSAVDYVIGYLIGIGWMDEGDIADVVEVVRCKDCTRQCICYHSAEYYCSDGERIDVRENVRGEWIKQPTEYNKYACSVCKAGIEYRGFANFCPCCGADMRGEP